MNPKLDNNYKKTTTFLAIVAYSSVLERALLFLRHAVWSLQWKHSRAGWIFQISQDSRRIFNGISQALLSMESLAVHVIGFWKQCPAHAFLAHDGPHIQLPLGVQRVVVLVPLPSGSQPIALVLKKLSIIGMAEKLFCPI